jgi:hypothetical protein
MTVQPQKRRAISISNKWTKPAETSSPTPSPTMKSQITRARLRGNSPIFLFGTAATSCHKTNNKQPQDEDITVCSNETQSTLYQRPKKHNRRKPTAMMRHRIWLKSQSPNNNNQTASLSQNKGRKEPPQSTNRVVQQRAEGIIRPFLNNNKTKKAQNSRPRSCTNESRTKTNKPRQKCHARKRTTRDTVLTSYHPVSSALRYALLRSNKRYKPGD